MNEQTIKPLTFFRFEDLRIYHKALDYVFWTNDVTKHFPEGADNDLRKGFSKAARSIPIHIAEGSAREKSQFVLHLKEAKSAIRTCLVYTTIAYQNHYINDSEEDESRNHLMEMTKMLGALITSLQKSSLGNNDQDEDDAYPTKPW